MINFNIKMFLCVCLSLQFLVYRFEILLSINMINHFIMFDIMSFLNVCGHFCISIHNHYLHVVTLKPLDYRELHMAASLLVKVMKTAQWQLQSTDGPHVIK